VLLFFLSAGAYAMWRGHRSASGCWLAAAATYKATPVLFLPFLLWKREWKAAGTMAGAILVLNFALPACFLGCSGALKANQVTSALSLNAAAGLLISPISWSHHWVWAAPRCSPAADDQLIP